MNLHGKDIKIFAGNSNRTLAESIAEKIGLPLGIATVGRFSDGEIAVNIGEVVRGSDVFIIQSTCHPVNENLVELLIMIDALKRASAGRITAVIPYFGYARQDRKAKARDPISAKLVANLITTAGADRVLTMDFHTPQLQGFFDIPLDHLYALPVLVNYLKKTTLPDSVVVAPDSGSVKLAHAYSDRLETGFAVVAKRRINANQVASSHLVGEVADRDCIIVDDLTTTAGTLIAAAEKLKASGAHRIFAAVSHCCLTDAGQQRLEKSCITELITTDSIPVRLKPESTKIKVLSVAKLLGEAEIQPRCVVLAEWFPVCKFVNCFRYGS